MPFLDNNVALGIKEDNKFQVGRSDVDKDRVGQVEQNNNVAWASDPVASWVYYDCTVGVMLDSGVVVHNRLPQVNNAPDTLAMCDLADPRLDTIVIGGVNLKCQDQYQDIVQRMGHARYWFHLWGQALRIGYQVPIPSIVKIGGVAVVPYDKNPQWAFNRIAPRGNYGGIILWHAAWSLWYTTAVPPVTNKVIVADPAAHISSIVKPPKGIQPPYSRPDDNAQKTTPVKPVLR